jgi:cold shock CspA family protein
VTGRHDGAEHRGQVVEFDEGAGLGRVRTPGGDVYPFHCTQIAGGSRTIPVGSGVSFTVVAGHPGRWEAAGLTPLDQAGAGAGARPGEGTAP